MKKLIHTILTEEINRNNNVYVTEDWRGIKKGIVGAALGTGLAMGSPIKGQIEKMEINPPTGQEVVPLKDLKPIKMDYPTESNNTTKDIVNHRTSQKISGEPKWSKVSNIGNYEKMVSMKVPRGFDIKNARIYASFLWDSNLPKAPFGGMIFIHSPKISFFIDVKSNWKFNDDPIEVENWTEQPSSFSEEYNTWQTSYGSYTTVHHDHTVSSGTVEHRKVFDVGISKKINKSESIDLRAYVGCGLSRTKTEMYNMVQDNYYQFTHYAALGMDDSYIYPFDPGKYKKTGNVYEDKLNITGGLIFEAPINGLQIGIGFDTKPAGLNLMVGFSINKEKAMR